VDVRADERLAQQLDHGDRRAHTGLETQLNPVRRRGREQLVAVARDELLVRRDDRLPRAEQVEHVAAGGLDPAHHLGHERDRRVVADLGGIGRQHARLGREPALLPGVAHERPHDPQSVPRRPLDVARALAQQPVDRRADSPVAEQCYGNVN